MGDGDAMNKQSYDAMVAMMYHVAERVPELSDAFDVCTTGETMVIIAERCAHAVIDDERAHALVMGDIIDDIALHRVYVPQYYHTFDEPLAECAVSVVEMCADALHHDDWPWGELYATLHRARALLGDALAETDDENVNTVISSDAYDEPDDAYIEMGAQFVRHMAHAVVMGDIDAIRELFASVDDALADVSEPHETPDVS